MMKAGERCAAFSRLCQASVPGSGYASQYSLLQFMVIGANVLIVPILHPETLWNGSQLLKAKTLVQMTGMNIRRHHCVELKNSEPLLFALSEAVPNKLFSYMQPS